MPTEPGMLEDLEELERRLQAGDTGPSGLSLEDTIRAGDSALAGLRLDNENSMGLSTEQLRREQIMDGAVHCFVKRGYAATRLLDIAQAAGISKGGVYFHYRAKEQLLRDILDNYVNLAQRAWGAVELDGPPEETLARLVRLQLEGVGERYSEAFLLMISSFSCYANSDVDAPRQAFSLMHDAYWYVLIQGQRAGVFRSDDPSLMAARIIAFVQGLQQQRAVLGTLEPIDPQLTLRMILRLVENEPVSHGGRTNRENSGIQGQTWRRDRE